MNLQKMMKQAQEMQAKMMQAQAALEAAEVEGTAANGAVKIVMTGKKAVKSVAIDQSLMDDKETLEDLLVVAFNDGSGKIDALAADQMGAATSGMKLPPGMKLPFS